MIKTNKWLLIFFLLFSLNNLKAEELNLKKFSSQNDTTTKEQFSFVKINTGCLYRKYQEGVMGAYNDSSLEIQEKPLYFYQIEMDYQKKYFGINFSGMSSFGQNSLETDLNKKEIYEVVTKNQEKRENRQITANLFIFTYGYEFDLNQTYLKVKNNTDKISYVNEGNTTNLTKGDYAYIDITETHRLGINLPINKEKTMAIGYLDEIQKHPFVTKERTYTGFEEYTAITIENIERKRKGIFYKLISDDFKYEYKIGRTTFHNEKGKKLNVDFNFDDEKFNTDEFRSRDHILSKDFNLFKNKLFECGLTFSNSINMTIPKQQDDWEGYLIDLSILAGATNYVFNEDNIFTSMAPYYLGLIDYCILSSDENTGIPAELKLGLSLFFKF